MASTTKRLNLLETPTYLPLQFPYYYSNKMLQNTDSPPFHLHQDDQQPPPNTISHSFPSGFGVGAGAGAGAGAEVLCSQSLAYVENFLRSLIQEEVEAKVKAHFNLTGQSSSNSSTSMKEIGDGSGGSGMENHLSLRFMNKIPSTIFTTNDIEAENGEELQVGLFDVINGYIIDVTHPLSSALIEVVVLYREFDDDEAITNFDRSVVSQRLGERPFLAGDGKRFRLRNGVASINNLSFTTNSSRTRTKNVRLGLRVIDNEILSINNYPTIRHAVSNPFRVKDHRGQLNKKHHPPRGEDEVWRLEGIGRNGEYHKRLASHGIQTVDSFVKAHQRDYRSLRKWLGNRVSDRKWKTMVNHALEYVPMTIPTFNNPPNFQENLVQNEAMGGVEVDNQNSGASNLGDGFQDQTFLADFQEFFNPIFQDHYPTPTLLSHGEASTSNTQNNHVENTSPCNQYFHGAWNKLVPKPK